MNLHEYFEKTHGTGVLATSGADGSVDAAVFARPHVQPDGTLAVIMTDRLTRKNLTENPHAAYLYKEDGPGWRGRRFFLTRIAEEQDTERIQRLRRRTYPPADEARIGGLYLVTFRVDRELPLIGPEVQDPEAP
jgi:hypothetical protein